MRSFLEMTAHFIYDWKLHSVLVSCKTFIGRQTSENILALFEEVADFFELTNKVSYVITDKHRN